MPMARAARGNALNGRDVEISGAIARESLYEFQSHSGDVRVTSEEPAGFDL